MSKGQKWAIIVGIAAFVLLISASIFFNATPMGVAMWNRWLYGVQKADDATNYNTLREVEETCRAMMASYTADKVTYGQYKDSDNEEKQGWGEQAKMRANKTAAIYNEYILKNSFVWRDGVPSDIYARLEMLGEEE